VSLARCLDRDRKRRWLIVFIVLLITATTAVMLARKPDIYLAESEVQVDTESPASGLTSGKGNAIIVDTFTDPSYFNTELQIISKPGLLRRVVKTLDLENNQDFLRAQAGDTAWQRLVRTFGLGGKSATQAPIQKVDNGRLLVVKDVASPTASSDLARSNAAGALRKFNSGGTQSRAGEGRAVAVYRNATDQHQV